ncbi:ATP-binding cassette domain-containing protein, partial [Haladaptatus sp. AB618]
MMSQQQETVTEVSDPILSIRNASVTYDEGKSYVLNDVSLDIQRNEIVGVVGESGSGKSMFAETILDAIPDPGLLQGEVIYRPEDGEEVNVLELSQEELRSMRWEQISMVFQGAMSSFNPTMKIEDH